MLLTTKLLIFSITIYFLKSPIICNYYIDICTIFSYMFPFGIIKSVEKWIAPSIQNRLSIHLCVNRSCFCFNLNKVHQLLFNVLTECQGTGRPSVRLWLPILVDQLYKQCPAHYSKRNRPQVQRQQKSTMYQKHFLKIC